MEAQRSWFIDFGIESFRAPEVEPSYVHIGVYARSDSKEPRNKLALRIEESYKKDSKRGRIVKMYRDGMTINDIAINNECSVCYVVRALRFAGLIEESKLQSNSGRKVVVYRDGAEVGRYRNGAEASRAFGVDDGRVSKVLRGVESHCRGYVFRWVDDTSGMKLPETLIERNVSVLKICEDRIVSKFKSITEAAHEIGISRNRAVTMIKSRRELNGFYLYREKDWAAMSGKKENNLIKKYDGMTL